MANIKEFRGLRSKTELAHLVAELPYDVVNVNEARAKAAGNKYSFYHILRPEIDLNEDISISDDLVYDTGRKNLEQFIDEGVLKLDPEPCMYLYSLVTENRSQTGLVACIHIDDYENGVIKKHEHTLSDKEEDRMNHINRLNAHTGLVFLFYREDDLKRNLFKEAIKSSPDYDFKTSDGVRHVFRSITDKNLIQSFRSVFIDQNMYIADGHHRAASAVRVGQKRRKKNPDHNGGEEYNWFLTVIFPHDQLRIMSYNRVVKDINGYTIDDFLNKLRERYYVKEIDDHCPSEKHRFCMYLNGKWYRLTPNFEINNNTLESLDTKILNDTILKPILGITEPRRDKRLDFIGGIKGYEELRRVVDSGEFEVAFSLNPISIEELMKVSDLGEMMPPKSTWFEPKLRSGLVIHLL
ncbi:MAG: DUF1015 family protein [Spirochaetota bacterium]|nr:DUF1015 family protein [Spirochaetota bacterium]